MVKRDIKCYVQREEFRGIVKNGRVGKRALTPATIENYVTILMKTMRFLDMENPEDLGKNSKLKDNATTNKLLSEYKSKHRRKQCLDTLISVYPELGYYHDEQRMGLNTAILHQAEKNEHKGPWFSWEEILKMPIAKPWVVQ